MARNFTREIRKALRPGFNRAVCSSAPYTGREVQYLPRNNHDGLPWVLMDWEGDYRFSGRECHVETFRYAVIPLGNRFAILDTSVTTSSLMVSRLDGPGLEEVAGILATSRLYSSRYAAKDAAKRLEVDGPLARIDLTPEQVIELAISSARRVGQTGRHIVAPKGHGWVIIDTQDRTLLPEVFPAREPAQTTAYRLDRISRPVRERKIRRDFTVTVGSHPHYFNDRAAAESFANSYGVAVTDNRKGN